jgi:hypothetical protein
VKEITERDKSKENITKRKNSSLGWKIGTCVTVAAAKTFP